MSMVTPEEPTFEKINFFMQKAVDLALENIKLSNGGPFAAIIARGDTVVGSGVNSVLPNIDPTAHAEVSAIREACRKINNVNLTGCILFSTCEPCPMCLGASQWARLDRIYYALTRHDAEEMGFDDARFHEDISSPGPIQLPPIQAITFPYARNIVEKWLAKTDKNLY